MGRRAQRCRKCARTPGVVPCDSVILQEEKVSSGTSRGHLTRRWAAKFRPSSQQCWRAERMCCKKVIATRLLSNANVAQAWWLCCYIRLALPHCNCPNFSRLVVPRLHLVYLYQRTTPQKLGLWSSHCELVPRAALRAGFRLAVTKRGQQVAPAGHRLAGRVRTFGFSTIA